MRASYSIVQLITIIIGMSVCRHAFYISTNPSTIIVVLQVVVFVLFFVVFLLLFFPTILNT